MYFKGDIIITDPCYLIKENKPKEESLPKILAPELEAFLTYPTVKDYPDATFWEEGFNILKPICCNEDNSDENTVLTLLREHCMKSDLYDQDLAKYAEARQAWVDQMCCQEYDDWKLCKNGENMESFGFTSYLTADTLIGDWSCGTFLTEDDTKIGEFCADAGRVGVFLLDEVLKYNPDFDYHLTKPWTTTLVKNFDGEIEIEDYITVISEDGETNAEVRVIGNGNINFYTSPIYD